MRVDIIPIIHRQEPEADTTTLAILAALFLSAELLAVRLAATLLVLLTAEPALGALSRVLLSARL